MTRRFVVIHEAKPDFVIATELADREIVDAVEWLDADQLPGQRTWLDAVGSDRLTWKAIPRLARDRGIRAHGHFDGRPGAADAAAARRAILYVQAALGGFDAIVLIRDRDDQQERRLGLEQARSIDYGGFPIVVGLAIVEREAWVLSGFVACDSAERIRLGFDPTARSHELTASKKETDKRSPKQALLNLTGGDHDRERRCWNESPLRTLRERGSENGLSMYLNEVRSLLAPLIGHVASN